MKYLYRILEILIIPIYFILLIFYHIVISIVILPIFFITSLIQSLCYFIIHGNFKNTWFDYWEIEDFTDFPEYIADCLEKYFENKIQPDNK